VGTRACNEITLTLTTAAPVDFGGDDLTGFDLSSDLAVPPDLAACTATTPDEDGDGRGDACDVCAADADPVIMDTDGDGVPNVCDPSPTVAGNKAVYFEPFNATPAWISALTVGSGAAQANLTAADSSAVAQLDIDTGTSLVTDVMLETWVTISQASAGIDGEIAIVLSTDASGHGLRCVLGWQTAGDPYVTVETTAGEISSDPVPAGFPLSTPLRVRLSQNANLVSCVVVGGSSGTLMASAMTSSPVQGPLHPGIGVDFLAGTGTGTIAASFSSLFAVTDP
jgi:hypothetical protein